MAKKNPAVIKMNNDGQFFHQSGSSMGSMSAAGAQAHKNLSADAKKHSAHGRAYIGGGFVIGKTQPGGSPQNSSSSFQSHALKAGAAGKGLSASPTELKAAASNPSGGLGYNKTVTVLKGGKRKRRKTQKRRTRGKKKSAKRFRKGGQPWGCFSGGRKSKRRRNRRKSSRKKSRKH